MNDQLRKQLKDNMPQALHGTMAEKVNMLASQCFQLVGDEGKAECLSLPLIFAEFGIERIGHFALEGATQLIAYSDGSFSENWFWQWNAYSADGVLSRHSAKNSDVVSFVHDPVAWDFPENVRKLMV